MGKRPRTKMPVSQRAKQFAPFKSLSGLDEVIRRAEEEHRRELETTGVVHVPVTEDPEYDGEDRAGKGTI